MTHFCSCNSINEIASGGASLGGSADISTYIPSGLMAGGTAIVEVRPDPWDGMIFVLPLDEDSTSYIDRTKHHLDGTSTTATSPIDDGVFCLPSQYFDGQSFISLPADDMKPTQGFTVSFWTKLEKQFQERTWYTRGVETDGHKMTFSLGHSYINHLWARINLTDGETDTVYYCFSSQNNTLAVNKWYHISATWTPEEKLRVFINGVLAGQTETPEASMVALTNGSQLGRLNQGQSITGNLQEVRLHPVAREASWLLAEYQNFCQFGWYVQGETVEAVLE